jgi:YVTN family beta-propeller protein
MKSLAVIAEVVLSIVSTVFAITCTGKAPQTNPLLSSSTEMARSPLASEKSGTLPLRTLRDVPLTGGASRFDYQSFDVNSRRLYIAHLGDGLLTVFDTNKETVVGDVKDLSRVHGVIAVPELHRIYASATGVNELAVIDDNTLQIVARVPAGDYPDGIAHAPKVNKIYVSDLHGKTDTVIDAKTNQRIATIALGGGAGNTQYDSVSEHIFVTVHGHNQLAEIDPTKDTLIGRYALTGCSEPHGLLIDSENRLAFVACEENARLAVFDLSEKKMTGIYAVGADPDVLAFDKGFGRLYVSAESGTVTIFDENDRSLDKVGEGFFAPNAHSVAVDPRTHRVFFPLQNIGGKPVLRIALPSDKKL